MSFLLFPLSEFHYIFQQQHPLELRIFLFVLFFEFVLEEQQLLLIVFQLFLESQRIFFLFLEQSVPWR